MNDLISVDFEIFGKVQGVFFRKHTKIAAEKLGLNGYVQNTSRGTVVGTVQGKPATVEQMKTWLKSTGSPKSKIEKARFTGRKQISHFAYNGFTIVRE